MTPFAFRPRQRVRPSRSSRALRPAVEGFEPRRLMSGATLGGTAFRDLTGNGSSPDDTPRAGVTIDLYQKGSTTVLKSTSTDQAGHFSFTNLSPGSYSLQQVVPAGFLATGAPDGYSVTLKSGQNLTGQNFDDFQILPRPALSQLHYTVTTPGGKSRTVSSLDGNIQQGDTVTATFALKTPEVMTLVAYTAPNGDFDTKNLQEQVIFSEAGTSGAMGTESLTVKVPDGYFQVDFVAGPAIDHLATNANVYYHAQDRFIDGQQGGDQPDAPATVPTAAAPPALVNTATPATVAAPVVSADLVVASPDGTQASKH